MVGQYFKKRREAAEATLGAASGLGVAAAAAALDSAAAAASLSSWRGVLQAAAAVAASAAVLGAFYRSATMYHPQRRAILHLTVKKTRFPIKYPKRNIRKRRFIFPQSQKRKITIKNGHGGRAAGESASPLAAAASLAACLRRRASLRAAVAAAAVAAAGLYSPLLYLVRETSPYPVSPPSFEIGPQILRGKSFFPSAFSFLLPALRAQRSFATESIFVPERRGKEGRFLSPPPRAINERARAPLPSFSHFCSLPP